MPCGGVSGRRHSLGFGGEKDNREDRTATGGVVETAETQGGCLIQQCWKWDRIRWHKELFTGMFRV